MTESPYFATCYNTKPHPSLKGLNNMAKYVFSVGHIMTLQTSSFNCKNNDYLSSKQPKLIQSLWIPDLFYSEFIVTHFLESGIF